MKLLNRIYKIVAVIVVATLTSCTHEYTCQCYISYSGQPGLPDTLLREYPVRDTKDNASKLCEEHSKTFTEGNITTVQNCRLW